MPIIQDFQGKWPILSPDVFVAENAVVIGDTVIGPDSSIWYGCIVRGDVNNIVIGARTNIQDGTVVHVAQLGQGAYIGNDVTVGHMALIHACTIGSRVLVGMQTCVMDDAQVGDDVIIAAGSLVTPGKVIPSGQLWAGRPARYVRDLTEADYEMIALSSRRYVGLAAVYRGARG